MRRGNPSSSNVWETLIDEILRRLIHPKFFIIKCGPVPFGTGPLYIKVF